MRNAIAAVKLKEARRASSSSPSGGWWCVLTGFEVLFTLALLGGGVFALLGAPLFLSERSTRRFVQVLRSENEAVAALVEHGDIARPLSVLLPSGVRADAVERGGVALWHLSRPLDVDVEHHPVSSFSLVENGWRAGNGVDERPCRGALWSRFRLYTDDVATHERLLAASRAFGVLLDDVRHLRVDAGADGATLFVELDRDGTSVDDLAYGLARLDRLHRTLTGAPAPTVLWASIAGAAPGGAPIAVRFS